MAKKKEAKIKRADLEATLENMMEVMDYGITEDSPLGRNKGKMEECTPEELIEQIKMDAEIAQEGDKFSPITLKVFAKLGIEIAGEEKSNDEAPVKEEKSNDEAPVKEEKKTATRIKGSSAERIKFATTFISKKVNKKELIEKMKAQFPEATSSAISTLISDGKNPKYTKFSKLIVENEGVLSFAK